MLTVVLLTLSNVFMTFAWYGHLRFRESALWQAILVSWLIALPEYCFQVPANRFGHGRFNAAQLKTIQEVVSLSIFCIFSVAYLGERVTWNHAAGFALIVAGAYLVFLGR